MLLWAAVTEPLDPRWRPVVVLLAAGGRHWAVIAVGAVTAATEPISSNAVLRTTSANPELGDCRGVEC